MQYNSFIFDFDGTLFDTLPSYTYAYLEMASEFGFNDTYEEVFEWFSMHGTGYAIRKHDWKCKYSEASLKLQPIKEKIALENAKPFDGVEAIFDMIKEYKGDIYLFSDNNLQYVEKMINKFGLNNYFKEILCSTGGIRFFRCKPDPEGLVYLINKNGLVLEKTVYIGDRESDAQTAKLAGVDCIYINAMGNWDMVDAKFKIKKLLEIKTELLTAIF